MTQLETFIWKYIAKKFKALPQPHMMRNLIWLVHMRQTLQLASSDPYGEIDKKAAFLFTPTSQLFIKLRKPRCHDANNQRIFAQMRNVSSENK